MPDPKTVAQLKANILRPALTSHYSVKMSVPQDAASFIQTNAGITLNSEFFELSCSEASLPGSSLATLDITNDYVGVSEKHAYRRLYDDRADFTFYVDHDYVPIRFFESWMRYITNEQYAKGLDKRTFVARPNYPSKYCTDQITIEKFERDYSPPLIYSFIKAFPVSINSMLVSYDTSNLLKVTVSFVYSRYFIKPYVPVPQQTTITTPNPILQIAENTAQFAQTGQNLARNPLGNGTVGNLIGRAGPGF